MRHPVSSSKLSTLTSVTSGQAHWLTELMSIINCIADRLSDSPE